MVLQRPPFAGLLLLSAVASGLGAIFALRRRETPGAIPLSVIMVAAGWWAVAYTFQLASTTLGAKLFWWQVKYVGIAVIPTAFLVFVLQYIGQSEWVNRRTIGLLSIGPLVNLGLVWTNHQHHFYVSHATLETANGLVMLDTPIAIGFWLVVVYNYLLLLLGAVLVFRMFAVTDHLFRSQTAAMLIGVAAPWLSNVLFILDIRPAGIDITPLAFIITGMALLWAVFRHELLEIVPIPRDLTREALLDTITDATVVVDENGMVVDINPAGRELAAEVSDPIGRHLDRVYPELDALVERGRSETTTHEEVEIGRTDGNRYFDVQVSPLQGVTGPRGHIVILHDITGRARHRQRLEVMNRVLRHDIRNDINLILAHADEVLNGNGECEERVDRIKDLAFDVVDLSERARTAGESLGREDVLDTIDLVPVIEQHLDELRRDYPDADIAHDLPGEAIVWAHPLIDSAVNNVIENALEHNNRDTPTLAVSIRDGDEDDFVDLQIADNGPGIPSVEREVIRSGTETQVQHSSGLGLWLTNWIISESGGDVSFADNDPRGTVLTVRLRDAGTERPAKT